MNRAAPDQTDNSFALSTHWPLALRVLVHSFFWIALSLLLFAALGALQLRQSLQQHADAVGQSLARQAAIAASDALVAKDNISLNVLLKNLSEDPLVAQTSIQDTHNNLLAQAGNPPAEGLLKGGRAYDASIRFQGADIGKLQLTLDMGQFQLPLSEGLENLALVGLVLLALALISSWQMGRRLSLPLRHLIFWLEDPEGTPPHTKRRDEVGALARQLQAQLSELLLIEPEADDQPMRAGDFRRMVGPAPKADASRAETLAPETAEPGPLASEAVDTENLATENTPTANAQAPDSEVSGPETADREIETSDASHSLGGAVEPGASHEAGQTDAAPEFPIAASDPTQHPDDQPHGAGAPVDAAQPSAPGSIPADLDDADFDQQLDDLDRQTAVLAVRFDQEQLRPLPGLRATQLEQHFQRSLERAARLYRGELHQLGTESSLILFHSGDGENYLTYAICCGELLRALGQAMQLEIADSRIRLRVQLGLAVGQNLQGLDPARLTQKKNVQSAVDLCQHSRNLLLLEPHIADDHLANRYARIRQIANPQGAFCVERLLGRYASLLERHFQKMQNAR